MKRVVAILLLFLSFSAIGVSQKQKTLRDEVKEKGYAKHGWFGDLPLFEPHTTDQLIRRSAIIIVGRVTSEAPRLSTDETQVLTDYAIDIDEVLKDASGTLNTDSWITVSKFGGSLTLDGKPVVFETPQFPPIPHNVQTIFFVSQAEKPNPFWKYMFSLDNISVWRFKADKFECENKQKREAGYTASLCRKPQNEVLSLLKERIQALGESR